MSRFYGTVQGNKGKATRCGHASSGIRTEAAGWGGCIDVCVYDVDGDTDGFIVTMKPWHGNGDSVRIASGIIGDSSSIAIEKELFDAQAKREIAERAHEVEADVIDDWDSYP